MTRRSSGFFRMQMLDRFILGELMGPFFFGIMAFTIILVAGSLLFKISDLVIERGVSFGVVIRLFLYYMPRLVAFTIPMSCLLAALLGFGKLSSNSELVALKSAGLSFNRIIRPVIIASLVISVAAFFINETLVPISERAAANVMYYEVFKNTPPVFKEKVFLKEEKNDSLNRVIYVNRMKLDNGDMEEVVVEEFEQGRLSRVISAHTGKWVNGAWWIENGKVYDISADGKVSFLFAFDKQELNLNLNPREAVTDSSDPDQMTVDEIYKTIQLKKKLGENTAALWMTLQLRISVPWACLVLALVGAALGSRPQRSNSSVGLGMSVIIVFVYYVIMSFSKSIGEAGYVPPVVAAWTANAVFLAVGAILCKRANRLG